ncbi:hypothetical protein PHYPSEUDO_015067 [Phytophthora pseudosyringae]|uniref:MORN repeat-containing protein 1 n=1 Tax=Phytophthora pseudosyringae TaxID=221518 RepID=A0A8T1WLS5_9STRA|nr:hypothetical protein PHYPSEUDO_015067 [Phytophthora pseudosyringae]
MYVGEYKGLLRDGHGSYTFPGNYFHYSGQWRKGKMHGQGEFTMGDGTTYEGEFVDGEIEGVGLKRWPDGSSYSGQFHQGEMHGEGVYLSAKGERYEGHWENNQRCGHGVLQLPNGDLYSGNFAAHRPNGRGTMAYVTSGHVYDGEWVAGARCGTGLLRDASGNRLFEGHWSSDHRHGDGIGTLSIVNNAHEADNEVSSSLWYRGRWDNDEPEARTNKIAVMAMTKRLGSRPASASDNQETLTEDQLHELPVPLIIENKRIPTLAVVCMSQISGQDSTSSDATRVQGEHGRRFRLRIFEGTIPQQTASGEEVEVAAGSAWKFVSSDQSTSRGKLLQLSESEQLVPNLGPTNTNVSTGEGNAAEAGDTEGPAEDVSAETCLDAVTAEASAGLAVFRDLVLPAKTLIGDYYLLCESLTSDSLPPAFIPLAIKETP